MKIYIIHNKKIGMGEKLNLWIVTFSQFNNKTNRRGKLNIQERIFNTSPLAQSQFFFSNSTNINLQENQYYWKSTTNPLTSTKYNKLYTLTQQDYCSMHVHLNLFNRVINYKKIHNSVLHLYKSVPPVLKINNLETISFFFNSVYYSIYLQFNHHRYFQFKLYKTSVLI